MRLLFVKARLAWPRTHGHDVHCFEMMRALGGLGHEVALATDQPTSPKAIEGLGLAAQWTLEGHTADPVAMSYLQERYRSYWGIAHGRIAHLRAIAAEWKPDAVVVVGLEILPYLTAPQGPRRVWYAADEWVWHYISQLASDPRNVVTHLRQAALKGLYERAFASVMDRIWVVSPAERRAMRLVTGCRGVDVIPNGVDSDTFNPAQVTPQPYSAVFWGRLGFGPNLQALRWFVERVWPLIRESRREATFAILGADPPASVTAWHGSNGITVTANLEDLRPEISRRAVAVLPFVSGGGIKNKLLEAAAMGRPIVATPRAMSGLRTAAPAVVAGSPQAFAAGVVRLWSNADEARVMGAAARQWVIDTHSWRAAAAEAVACLRLTDQAGARRP
ncbi:MAG: glycosyltransferase [Acidobacteria bacterium]|nr:glycosyltransferase [Acidobacteriota bacterium]